MLTNAVTPMEDVVRIAQTQWEASFVSVKLDICSPTKQSVLVNSPLSLSPFSLSLYTVVMIPNVGQILMNVRATSPCV